MAVKVIEVHESVYGENDRIAAETRAAMKREGTLLVNLMSSPGSGKTTLLLATARALAGRLRMGVMEADIDATGDAEAMLSAGIDSIQVHTGGQCAMDAQMTKEAVDAVDVSAYDVLVLENVGNLVCPAEVDTGASVNVVILSVPEGDDKPLKYPLMFEKADVVLVSKTDVRAYFPFDDEAFEERVRALNPRAQVITLSAKTGEGMEGWIGWLESALADWRS